MLASQLLIPIYGWTLITYFNITVVSYETSKLIQRGVKIYFIEINNSFAGERFYQIDTNTLAQRLHTFTHLKFAVVATFLAFAHEESSSCADIRNNL